MPPFKRIRRSLQIFYGTYSKTMTAYVKIFVSFWQIMSTFESTYTTEWPQAVERVWEIGNALSLKILNFPGPNCLANSLNHLGVLQITTIVPAIVCLLLYIPTLILVLNGERSKRPLTFRFKNTRDHFWHACLFWLFVVYPLVSITSVQGLKCRKIGDTWWLETDLNEECPWTHPSSLTFIWSVLAILAYPIGIPLFAYWQLRRKRIPELAAIKHEEEMLHAMLVEYKEYASDTVYRELALNIGSGQHNHDQKLVLNRIRYMYDDATGNGETPLTRDLFEQYLVSTGIVDAKGDMKEILSRFQVDAHDIILWENFLAALQQIVGKENHLMGISDVKSINTETLQDLCHFRWQNLQAPRSNVEQQDTAASFAGASSDGASFRRPPPAFANTKLAFVFGRKNNGSPIRGTGPDASRRPSSEGEGRQSPMSAMRAGSQSRVAVVRGPSMGRKRAAELLLGDKAGRMEMLDYLLYQGSKLVSKGVISIHDILWNGATVAEQEAVESLGFLFENYKVQHYNYELLEMARKFAMTGLVIFLWPGSPEQIAIALIVTIFALFYVLKLTPYANYSIGSLQAAMLAAQAATLFYGLMLRIDVMRQQLHKDDDEENIYTEVASAVILILLSTVIFFVPALILVYDNRREIQKYCAPNTLRQHKRTRTRAGDADTDKEASPEASGFDVLKARTENLHRVGPSSSPRVPPRSSTPSTPQAAATISNAPPLPSDALYFLRSGGGNNRHMSPRGLGGTTETCPEPSSPAASTGIMEAPSGAGPANGSQHVTAQSPILVDMVWGEQDRRLSLSLPGFGQAWASAPSVMAADVPVDGREIGDATRPTGSTTCRGGCYYREA